MHTDSAIPILIEEEPVQLLVDGLAIGMMLMTPHHLEDFTYGFLYSEGLINDPQTIRTINIESTANLLQIQVETNGYATATQLTRLQQRPHWLENRSSCGLCGSQEIASFLPVQGNTATPTQQHIDWRTACEQALPQLRAHQPLHRQTGAAHAAALINPTGEIMLAREDIGRHNALDKLLGAALQAGLDFTQHGVIMTSRLGYELILKALRAQVAVLASDAATSTLAVRMARQGGLALRSRSQGKVIWHE